MGVLVAVRVGVTVGSSAADSVDVAVGRAVLVEVGVYVAVGRAVGVLVAVRVGVGVGSRSVSDAGSAWDAYPDTPASSDCGMAVRVAWAIARGVVVRRGVGTAAIATPPAGTGVLVRVGLLMGDGDPRGGLAAPLGLVIAAGRLVAIATPDGRVPRVSERKPVGVDAGASATMEGAVARNRFRRANQNDLLASGTAVGSAVCTIVSGGTAALSLSVAFEASEDRVGAGSASSELPERFSRAIASAVPTSPCWIS